MGAAEEGAGAGKLMSTEENERPAAPSDGTGGAGGAALADMLCVWCAAGRCWRCRELNGWNKSSRSRPTSCSSELEEDSPQRNERERPAAAPGIPAGTNNAGRAADGKPPSSARLLLLQADRWGLGSASGSVGTVSRRVIQKPIEKSGALERRRAARFAGADVGSQILDEILELNT